MTNKEKFKETFGFEPNLNRPPCRMMNEQQRKVVCEQTICRKCPFNGSWWDREYLPCFAMKEVE